MRVRGVNASWSSDISWFAELSRMGGVINIGDNVIIDKGVILRAYGGSIVIGDNCSVNPYCVLYGHGGLHIGNCVRIAAQSVFIPANHNFADPNVLIYLQGESIKGITVEDDVWIGAGTRVLDGVTIGRGSVVGAGSVVAKTLLSNGVYVGVPARMIKKRGA